MAAVEERRCDPARFDCYGLADTPGCWGSWCPIADRSVYVACSPWDLLLTEVLAPPDTVAHQARFAALVPLVEVHGTA